MRRNAGKRTLLLAIIGRKMRMLKNLAGPLFAAAALFCSDAPAAVPAQVSDAALVQKLPGFSNGNAVVNGVTLHYVRGGKGPPLVLLPGWPETWWEWHKLMPALDERRCWRWAGRAISG
jgi:hypothetical protein